MGTVMGITDLSGEVRPGLRSREPVPAEEMMTLFKACDHVTRQSRADPGRNAEPREWLVVVVGGVLYSQISEKLRVMGPIAAPRPPPEKPVLWHDHFSPLRALACLVCTCTSVLSRKPGMSPVGPF